MESRDKILGRNVEKEMKDSYIQYAMSVIVARALPDVRDGLKPVHRRILYSMNELNLDPSKGYKKSARIVGDTMGKYHPHGDSSIYDAMVRMAQPFSMRYMLVDGHGNFGSIDGDSAAAQRYTEAKLQKLSMELLRDIEKNTVDFMKNYDEEFMEPTVMPARFPNLLVNGSSGIAVGMATNIPPHNLREVCDAITLMINNKIENDADTDIEDLIQIITGPDFPTSATILGTSGIKSAYRTGRGKVIVRAECEIKELSNGKNVIEVTELPYQVNKAKTVERIAELVKDKKIDGITDLRDESDREGIKIVIELRRDVNANVILNQLFKYSQLQETFGVNMLALVKNEPKVLNLKQMLGHYIEHQKDVVTRRSKFELEKAEKRAHILEGLFIALDNIDEVIRIIRASSSVNEAKVALIERFGLSDAQATAIVEMRLRSLTGLERDRLQKEFDELMELIVYLKSILGDEHVLYTVIRDELLEIKDKYGDDRRTKILPSVGQIEDEDLIDDELSVITMTHMDYIKRIPLNTYKSQNRGGKGVLAMQTRDEDEVKSLFICNTHEHLLFFTNRGKVYRIKGYQVPEAGRTAKGTAIINLLNLEPGEKVRAVIPIREFYSDKSFVMVTKNGIMKKTKVDLYNNIRPSGLIAINILDDDELVNVALAEENDTIFVATRDGKGIMFSEDNVRNLSRNTTGVKSISLSDDDAVIGFVVLKEGDKILTVSENGYGKTTEIEEMPLQKRSGKGVIIYKVTEKTGKLLSVLNCTSEQELMLLNSNGVIIRIKVEDIPTSKRSTMGVKLINVAEEDQVIDASIITKEQLDAEQVVEADEE